MSIQKDWARLYAQEGWPVLLLYAMVPDEHGYLVCQCGTPPSEQKGRCNPGKHPIFGSNGAHDATTDIAVIDEWPEGDINIGIAGRDTFVIFDIDDEEIADKLRTRTDLCLASTGRGLHGYLQCAPTKNGILFRRDTGQAIGEVRASGYYVVAPPSLHESGVYYEWINKNIINDGPTQTRMDAWGFIEELLMTIGVEIKDKNEGKAVAASLTLDHPIPQTAGLPFDTTNAQLLSMIQPSYPAEGDRSAGLFHLACELIRDVRRLNLSIDEIGREDLAGVIKHVDKTRMHPKGPKFAYRRNADKYYWGLLLNAESSVESGAQEDDGLGVVTAADGNREYGYSPTLGFFYDPTEGTDPKKRQRISNFEAKWVERLVYWKGDDHTDGDSQEEYTVVVKQDDEEITLRVPPSSYEEPRELTKFIRRKTPPYFVIEDRMSGKFHTGLGKYSGRPAIRNVYEATGWLPDQDKFILPGAPGAIGAHDGWDETIVFDSRTATEMMAPRLFDTDADIETTLRTLMSDVPAKVLIPIFLQYMAAPFCSIGLTERTLLHVLGETGAYKSSLMMALLSVYGHVKGDAQGRVSWQSGTENALRAALYNHRDLPVLMDDYKTGLVEQRKANALIQGYGDTSGRQRLTRELKNSQAHTPRGLASSSGENWWGGQRSTNYRTLLVRIKKGSVTLPQIIEVTNLATSGALSAIGVGWLRWLCENGKAALTDRLTDETAQARSKIVDLMSEEHARLVAALSGLFAINKMFLDFLHVRAPGIHAEYRKYSSEGFLAMLGSARDQAEEGHDVSPLSMLLTALSEAVSTGVVWLSPKKKGGMGFGDGVGRVVGYVDEGHMYITSWLTMGWYENELRSRGQSATIDWSAVVQDAKENFDGEEDTQYYYDASLPSPKRRARMLRLPLSLLDVDIEVGNKHQYGGPAIERVDAEDPDAFV